MEQVEGVLAAVTGILLVAWGISRFNRARPAVCDLVWRSALILIVLAPGVVVCRAMFVDWQWKIPIWPAEIVASTDLGMTSGQVSNPKTTLSRLRENHRTLTPALASQSVAKSSPSVLAEQELAPLTAEPLPATPRDIPGHPFTSSMPDWSWASVVIAAWSLGAAFHLIAIGVSARNGIYLRRTAKLVTDAECLALLRECVNHVGLHCLPRVSVNSDVSSPVVVGMFDPQIVIPPSLLRSVGQQDLKSVLLHECGHLKRNDLVFDLVLRFALAIFWPHPLLYVLAREMRRLREEMCDNFVLAHESAVQYAETLLRVAVGKRLNEAMLLGIGVFSKSHRLEQRVASLLSPSRRVETSASRRTQFLMVGVASSVLFAGFSIRLTSVSAAPPRSVVSTAEVLEVADDGLAESVAAVAPGGADNSINAAFEKAVAAAAAKPVVIEFRVVDMQGRPIVGAHVLPGGVSDFHGAFWAGDKGLWQVVESDDEGVVRFPLPLDVLKQAIVMQSFNGGSNGTSSIWGNDPHPVPEGFPAELKKLGIRHLYLRVDHPDHPMSSNYVELKHDAKIQLADSVTIVARGRRAGEAGLAQQVVPWLTSSHSTDWSEDAGVVTYRRVNLTDLQSRPCFQLIQLPEQGVAWFSDIVDLKHLAGNPVSLDLTLKRGVRVEGRLADDVPRPVKNGIVLGKMVHLAGDDSQGTAWNVRTTIDDDGTFVMESLPLHQTLQLIALCDGWNSRSPSQAEFAEFKASHHFPREKIGFASAANMFPRLLRVEESDIHAFVVPMMQTTSCEITAVDAENQPVAGVQIQFNPNQRVFHWGSTLLGAGQDDAKRLREQQITGIRDHQPPMDFNQNKYVGVTDAQGKVTIFGLPCAASDAPVGHELATFFATHEQYVAQSPTVGNMPKIMGSPFLAVKLTEGHRSQVTLRMLPRAIPQFVAEPSSDDVEQPAASLEESSILSGRVEDDRGLPLEDVKVLIVDEDCYAIRTDARGVFRHRFDSEMIVPGELAVLPLRFVKNGFAPAVRDVRIGSGDETIQLLRNTWFEGTVLKSDGSPAAHVPVRAFHERYSSSLQSELNLKTETTTDTQGRYLMLVEPAEYRIIAGHAVAGVAWVPKDHSGSRIEQPKLPIFPGEHRSLDIQLEPGVRFIAELIDRHSGQPISDASLLLYNNADPSDGNSKGDESGIVTYPALPAGPQTFQVYAPNYLRWRSEQAIPVVKGDVSRFVPTNKSLTFELRAEMPPVQIALEPGVEVSGVVLDPLGQPVAATVVYLALDSSDTSSHEITQYPHRVDEHGRFRFLVPVSDTLSCRLVAQPQQGQGASAEWSSGISRPFIVEVGSPIHDLDIRLTKPGTVRGRVVDRQGNPVASVFVQASAAGMREPSEYCPSTTCQRDGTFELKPLRPGRYWFHGKALPTEVQSTLQAEVQSGEVTQLGDIVIPFESIRDVQAVD